MRVSVDAAKCAGHGRCYVLAPDVFGRLLPFCAPRDGVSPRLQTEREADVPLELEDQARLGADNCPESAIRIG